MRIFSILAAGLLLLGGWLWLRDSALVSVRRVVVSGVVGPDAPQIRKALMTSAQGMTTLDVNMGTLRMAVAPYPVVKDLKVSTDLPHGLKIDVVEQVPVATISVRGRNVPVASDGTLLHDSAASSALPVIQMTASPAGSRVRDPSALSAVSLLAATPSPLTGKVAKVTMTSDHGLVAVMRNGPSIYFGDGSALATKWLAASEVLADPGSAGATYIDVSDPKRPAAGAGSQAAAAAGNQPGAASATGTDQAGSSSAGSAGAGNTGSGQGGGTGNTGQ